jgi:type III secretion protein F
MANNDAWSGTFVGTAESTQGTIADSTWVKEEYIHRTGMDVIWSQAHLADQMTGVEQQMMTLEQNNNLSDVNKMFEMQMLIAAWQGIQTLRTNLLRCFGEACKKCASNIS